jgi:transcriptional regulator with XRE-family HTH domain
MDSIGDRIKQVRLRQRMTQTELARRVGVSGATVADLESNVEDGTAYVAKFSYVLGVTPLWLTEGKGEPHAGVPAARKSEEERLPPEVIAVARKLLNLPDEKLRALAVILDLKL